jgi:hypothetical protein
MLLCLRSSQGITLRTNGKTIAHAFGNLVPTSLVIFGITSPFTFRYSSKPLIALSQANPYCVHTGARQIPGMGDCFPSLAQYQIVSCSSCYLFCPSFQGDGRVVGGFAPLSHGPVSSPRVSRVRRWPYAALALRLRLLVSLGAKPDFRISSSQRAPVS